MKSQARSIWCSYGHEMETLLPSCGHTCTDLGIGSERKEGTEKLVKVGKFFFYVMVDCKIFTHLKNKK